MSSIVYIYFLALLLLVCANTSKAESLEIEDGGLDFLTLPSWTSEFGSKVLINVDSLGAVGDGISDDTKAFADAWKQACSTEEAVLLVPPNRTYLVNATRLKGPCADNLIVQIDGTLKAPDEPKKWDPRNPRIWLYFNNITGVIFQGNGVIEGSGKKWWAASCKKNMTNPCVGAPTALTIDRSSNIVVNGLTIKNSQQMHFTVSRSESVRIFNVVVSAPEDSPNTDGIHLTSSKNVVIENTKIGTGFVPNVTKVQGSSPLRETFGASIVPDDTCTKGFPTGTILAPKVPHRDDPCTFVTFGTKLLEKLGDDCVSIVSGCSNIKMKAIYCGPGHGISIGSLGNNNSTGFVSAVVLDTAFLKGTTNGLRIKTYQGGSGYVRAVRYSNIQMVDVANPIIIDQFYCDSPKSCPNQTSAVEISQIMYQNISGTSKSPKAMKFSCSDTVPCNHIVLNNINLKRSDGKSAETFCNSAQGFYYGYVQPSADCLMSSNDSFIKPHEENNFKSEYLIHSEL